MFIFVSVNVYCKRSRRGQFSILDNCSIITYGVSTLKQNLNTYSKTVEVSQLVRVCVCFRVCEIWSVRLCKV